MLSTERKERNQKSLGAAVRRARVNNDMTQKALADALGLEYYTIISQIENGYISIPASMWVPIAETLGMDRSEWVIRCLIEYQPDLYKALFGKAPRTKSARLLSAFNGRSLDDLLR